MILVYCYSTVDQSLALKNVRWWNELGDYQKHEIVVGWDKRCDPTVVDEIQAELTKTFKKVHPLPFRAEIDGWPQGANYFFRTTAARLETKPDTRCFFWMEPDAIPLREGWLDAIQAEYERFKKPFMGDRVQVQVDGKDVPLHMSGVGVYPLPLHRYSGEAYMAFDIAWDMAGRDKIVSQAHFTRLIEHAWKHPRFTSIDELRTQIRPEAVLFHSSKDGSLIDLLRGRKQLDAAITGGSQSSAHPKDTDEPVSPSPITPFPVPQSDQPAESPALAQVFTTGVLLSEGGGEAFSVTGAATGNGPTPTRGAFNPVADIFIRTYPADYPWLNHSIRSIQRFASGFRKVWIVSPEAFPFPVELEGFEWKQLNEESEDGYLSQQIHKLYADVITDYGADYILHIDSDTLFTRPVTPADFFQGDKLIWYFTPYEDTQTPWKPITEKFMDEEVANEFMRRLPMMMPRWLYPKLREFCFKHHKRIISEYIRTQPYREFSEFNALGAFAYRFYRDKFHWVNTLDEALPPPFARQFFSWGGITEEVKKEIAEIFKGGDAKCDAPVVTTGVAQPNPNVQFTLHTSNGALPVQPADAPLTPKQEMKQAVRLLRDYAAIGKHERSCVMQSLRFNGLSARWGKPKHRKKF